MTAFFRIGFDRIGLDRLGSARIEIESSSILLDLLQSASIPGPRGSSFRIEIEIWDRAAGGEERREGSESPLVRALERTCIGEFLCRIYSCQFKLGEPEKNIDGFCFLCGIYSCKFKFQKC